MSDIVYFIRGQTSRFIKIGRTRQLRARFSHIQSSTSERIELIGSISGGADVEQQLHEEFSKDRQRGEWFAPSPEMEARIAALISEHGITPARDSRGEPDEYSKTGTKFVTYLLERESAKSGQPMARCYGDVAQATGLVPGSIENIWRGRTTRITVSDYEALRTAYLAEMEINLAEVRRTLAEVQDGTFVPPQSQLGTAKTLLEG